jgi:cold-inducible RNA-binding protein
VVYLSKRLYVGNLPYSVTDEALNTMFSEVGTVASANIISDRMSGRPKGFGFVEMENDEDAQKAIDQLNGKDMEGRAIVVNEARPMNENRDSNRGSGGGGGGFRDRRY